MRSIARHIICFCASLCLLDRLQHENTLQSKGAIMNCEKHMPFGMLKTDMAYANAAHAPHAKNVVKVYL